MVSPFSQDEESAGSPSSAAETWRSSMASQNGPRATTSPVASNSESGVVVNDSLAGVGSSSSRPSATTPPPTTTTVTATAEATRIAARGIASD